MGLIFKLIIPFLYSTSSPKIITNGYKFFYLYNIPNRSAIWGAMWFLVTLLFTIILNCLLYYLILKFKCLLIIILRV